MTSCQPVTHSTKNTPSVSVFEKKLIMVISISGILLIPILILHAYYMSREFSSPITLNIHPISNEGYTARVDLKKDNKYGIVVNAIMHRNKEVDFRNSMRVFINNNEVALLATDRISGNNTHLDFKWISQTQQLMRQKLYLYDFVSPVTCNPCNIKIKGHSPSYLNKYKIELHRNINHFYYLLGYMVTACLAVFILSWLVATPYIIVFKFIPTWFTR